MERIWRICDTELALLHAVRPEATFGLDGRMLMVPFVDNNGFPAGKGVRLYEVPDDVDSPEVAGGAATADPAHRNGKVVSDEVSP